MAFFNLETLSNLSCILSLHERYILQHLQLIVLVTIIGVSTKWHTGREMDGIPSSLYAKVILMADASTQVVYTNLFKIQNLKAIEFHIVVPVVNVIYTLHLDSSKNQAGKAENVNR